MSGPVGQHRFAPRYRRYLPPISADPEHRHEHPHIRRDPPEWVTERLGPRPRDPTACEDWDRAAAHLDDYREAFGTLPSDQPPELRDSRQRHAWEQVHADAAKALEIHPERPIVQRPPPQIHRDIELGLGR